MYHIAIWSIRAIPTYRVYRLYDILMTQKLALVYIIYATLGILPILTAYYMIVIFWPMTRASVQYKGH